MSATENLKNLSCSSFFRGFREIWIPLFLVRAILSNRQNTIKSNLKTPQLRLFSCSESRLYFVLFLDTAPFLPRADSPENSVTFSPSLFSASTVSVSDTFSVTEPSFADSASSSSSSSSGSPSSSSSGSGSASSSSSQNPLAEYKRVKFYGYPLRSPSDVFLDGTANKVRDFLTK